MQWLIKNMPMLHTTCILYSAHNSSPMVHILPITCHICAIDFPFNLQPYIFSIQILYFLTVESTPDICAASRTNKPANHTSWILKMLPTCSECSPNTRIKNFMFTLKIFLANRICHFRFLCYTHCACSYNQYIIQQMHFLIQVTYLTATCLNNEMPSSGSY